MLILKPFGRKQSLGEDSLAVEAQTFAFCFKKRQRLRTSCSSALQLAPAERTRLVDRPIATLDADLEVEEAWAVEVERRQSEIENGTVSYCLVQKLS